MTCSTPRNSGRLKYNLAARCAKGLDIPYIMSITGALTPWALKYKVWKKRIGWRLYQFADLQNAAVLHAASPEEVDNIRTLGLKNPIALIPLAIKIPPGKSCREKSRQLRTVLYISRIHRKKGLINLVEAWANLRPEGGRVVIAGQNDDGFRSEIETIIKRNGMEELFFFEGFISEEKNGNYTGKRIFLFCRPIPRISVWFSRKHWLAGSP